MQKRLTQGVFDPADATCLSRRSHVLFKVLQMPEGDFGVFADATLIERHRTQPGASAHCQRLQAPEAAELA
jgi:hypothetical protein